MSSYIPKHLNAPVKNNPNVPKEGIKVELCEPLQELINGIKTSIAKNKDILKNKFSNIIKTGELSEEATAIILGLVFVTTLGSLALTNNGENPIFDFSKSDDHIYDINFSQNDPLDIIRVFKTVNKDRLFLDENHTVLSIEGVILEYIENDLAACSTKEERIKKIQKILDSGDLYAKVVYDVENNSIGAEVMDFSKITDAEAQKYSDNLEYVKSNAKLMSSIDTYSTMFQVPKPVVVGIVTAYINPETGYISPTCVSRFYSSITSSRSAKAYSVDENGNIVDSWDETLSPYDVIPRDNDGLVKSICWLISNSLKYARNFKDQRIDENMINEDNNLKGYYNTLGYALQFFNCGESGMSLNPTHTYRKGARDFENIVMKIAFDYIDDGYTILSYTDFTLVDGPQKVEVGFISKDLEEIVANKLMQVTTQLSALTAEFEKPSSILK